MAQIFEADSMMKQWQLLEVFFKGISCYTHPVIQGKVRFIQVPNYLPEVCAQGEGTRLLPSTELNFASWGGKWCKVESFSLSVL